MFLLAVSSLRLTLSSPYALLCGSDYGLHLDLLFPPSTIVLYFKNVECHLFIFYSFQIFSCEFIFLVYYILFLTFVFLMCVISLPFFLLCHLTIFPTFAQQLLVCCYMVLLSLLFVIAGCHYL